ncbi:MAG TPA: GDP-mannose 4,6-dehydratase [Anaerolineales bacterium]|nr:GDP-mannose 4,6-dehydratase [Anaerolineales bacterium]
MTTTLITGINGFTGRYLSKLLASQGHRVHGIAHSPSAIEVPGAREILYCDLNDTSRLPELVSRVQPDHVVHLAAISHVAHENIDELYSTNVLGTRHLLTSLSKLKKTPESIILASSANIYGNSYQGMIDELTSPAPANDYGISKLASEYVARLFIDILPIIIVRPFNYTGVGQGTNFIIPKIIEHTRRKASVIELGNLDVARDFSDVRYVTEAYAKLLHTPSAIGKVLNICSGHAIDLNEALNILSKISGHYMKVSVNPSFVRANEVKSLWGDPSRLESIIGQMNKYSFTDTLQWMLEA